MALVVFLRWRHLVVLSEIERAACVMKAKRWSIVMVVLSGILQRIRTMKIVQKRKEAEIKN